MPVTPAHIARLCEAEPTTPPTPHRSRAHSSTALTGEEPACRPLDKKSGGTDSAPAVVAGECPGCAEVLVQSARSGPTCRPAPRHAPQTSASRRVRMLTAVLAAYRPRTSHAAALCPAVIVHTCWSAHRGRRFVGDTPCVLWAAIVGSQARCPSPATTTYLNTPPTSSRSDK